MYNVLKNIFTTLFHVPATEFVPFLLLIVLFLLLFRR